MLFSPAFFEVGFAALAGLPYRKHGFDLFMARKRVLERPAEQFKGQLTILLPIWNEAKVLHEKLENLLQTTKSFKPHLVIIDSASTDDSLSIARIWGGQDAFASYTILEMEERKGKTAAVQRALTHIEASIQTDLILMTDADAMLEADTVSNLMQWFSDPSIGCVGASPKRVGQRMEEEKHREMFSMVRNLESNIDSTPFLEGSCMMWRSDALQIDALYITSNADDAQIATNVRINGLRVIQDSDAYFMHPNPESLANH